MVCYGPSKGCRNCRARKIKCDEGRPGCRQCAKSKKECPGYDRGDGKVSFRDETRIVEKRATRKRRDNSVEDVYFGSDKSSESSASQASNEQLRRASLESQSSVRKPHPTAIAQIGQPPSSTEVTDALIKAAYGIRLGDYVPEGLPQDPELQAVCFFMTKFAQDSRLEEIWGGFMEVLAPLYTETGPKSALASATEATSMGSIAWNPTCADFKPLSISKYVTSLKRINTAVKDPKEAKSDHILMAVLMLGFYENIKSLTLQRSARESHTKGAVALIKARDPASFHSKVSLRLYLAVRAQLLGQCIENANPEPLEDFMTATEGAIPVDFTPSCADRLVILTMDVPHLRYREKQMLQETDYEAKLVAAQGLLEDAKEADARVASWSMSLPHSFFYNSLPLRRLPTDFDTTRDVYPRCMDVYRDTTMASTWNTWRVARMSLLTMIMRCADVIDPPQGSYHPSPEYPNALAIVHLLVDDICSSIPFHLGHHKKTASSENFADYPHPPGDAKWPPNFAASGAVGGWLMMPPLSFVSRLDCIPASQKEWIMEYLTTFMRDPRDMKKAIAKPAS